MIVAYEGLHVLNLNQEHLWAQLSADVGMVGPEIWLIISMCAVILVPFIKRSSVTLPIGVTMAGLTCALIAGLAGLTSTEGYGLVFGGSLTVDSFSQFFKVLLLIFTLAIILMWLIGSQKETNPYDTPDFLCLLLGATFGMSLMVSASSLLTIFIATESASIPSFALAGFRKRHKIGSEGSLKYVVFGAASSALMLYGMSLVYGTMGTLSLAGIRDGLVLAGSTSAGIAPLTAIGLLMTFAGIAFKLSAVPLHFWCPDVFQGAPIEVTTFLSVASKGAAICMLLRVLHALSGGMVLTDHALVGLGVGIGILGAITATWGNLVALHQTNIRRLLAYSSISHAGYMIMAASVMVVADRMVDGRSTVASEAISGAILFYLFVYLFMNLGAFTIASLIAQSRGTEDIRDYAGLLRTCPMLAIPLALFLLSLFGMPGLGGFIGKIYLMTAMADAGSGGFVLICVLLINTLLSLYYYMRPIYFMVFKSDTTERPPITIPTGGVVIVAVCVLMLVFTGLYPSPVGEATRDYGTFQFEMNGLIQTEGNHQVDQALLPVDIMSTQALTLSLSESTSIAD